MLNNINLFDKLNVLNLVNYIFIYNYIIGSYFFIRLPFIQRENTLNIIRYFISLEVWSNSKIIIKKIKFYYKISIFLINFFPKSFIINTRNWLFYFKFILIPYYIGILSKKNILYKCYNNILIFFLQNIFKVQIILRNLNDISLIKYIIFFHKMIWIKNIFIIFFINFFDTFFNFQYNLLWSTSL